MLCLKLATQSQQWSFHQNIVIDATTISLEIPSDLIHVIAIVHQGLQLLHIQLTLFTNNNNNSLTQKALKEIFCDM